MSDGNEVAGAVQKYWGIIKVPHDERAQELLGRCQSSKDDGNA